MRTKIFIAIGSTAIEGLLELVLCLKECGIYKDDASFRDQFIAIDTDCKTIETFKKSGSPKNVHGIYIPETDFSAIDLPTKNSKKYIEPFNASWFGDHVKITGDCVFGYRRKSYSDLSWVARLKHLIARTYNNNQPDEYELVFVATSYGGTSSGLLMNVAEIARTCIKSETPSYCFLMMPNDTLKTCGYKYYPEGWNNFLNTWQHFQQSVWESKLYGEKYAFPFFAGYMDEYSGLTGNCMSNNLFKIKEDIYNYRTAQTGANLPFNRIFPLVPNSEAYDRNFQRIAIAELSIFLFYACAMDVIREAHVFSCIHNHCHYDERNFVGLQLAGSRSSSYGTFYQKALQIFTAECERFFLQDIERTAAANKDITPLLDQFKIAAIAEAYKRIEEALKENQETQIVEDIFSSEVGSDGNGEYYAFLKQHVPAFPSFDEFVKNNTPEADSSLAWWLATYKKYYDDVKAVGKRFEYLRKKIRTVYNNIEPIKDKYAQCFLSKILNTEKRISETIDEDARKLLVQTFAEFHRAAVAKLAIERYEEVCLQSNGESYINKVSRWILGVSDEATYLLNWRNLRWQLAMFDSLDNDNQRTDMFVRNITGDITAVCKGYKLQADALAAIHKFLNYIMLDASFGEYNRMNSLIRLQPMFDSAMEILIEDLQTYVSSLRKTDSTCSIQIGLDTAQETFWSKDKKVDGKSDCLVYFAKGGQSKNQIDFAISPSKIREQLLNALGLNAFEKILPEKCGNIEDVKNPDWEISVQNKNWTLTNTDDKTDELAVWNGCYRVEYKEHWFFPAQDLFGLWVGSGKLCMSAKEVIESYLALNTLNDHRCDPKKLQSRLLFTLPEVVFYGTFIGIVRNKLNAEMKNLSIGNAFDGNTSPRICLRISSPNSTDVYNTPEQGIGLSEFGYDLTTNCLQAVPLDMMTTLSKWFKRRPCDMNKVSASDFANAFGNQLFNGKTLAEWEEYIEEREVFIFKSNMNFGIEDDLYAAIDEIYAECEKLVECEIIIM